MGNGLKLLYKKNFGREQKAVWSRQCKEFGEGAGRKRRYILLLAELLTLCVHPGRRTQQAKLGFPTAPLFTGWTWKLSLGTQGVQSYQLSVRRSPRHHRFWTGINDKVDWNETVAIIITCEFISLHFHLIHFILLDIKGAVQKQRTKTGLERRIQLPGSAEAVGCYCQAGSAKVTPNGQSSEFCKRLESKERPGLTWAAQGLSEMPQKGERCWGLHLVRRRQSSARKPMQLWLSCWLCFIYSTC